MLNFLRSLFFPRGEITETLYELSKLLGVQITQNSFKQSLEDHPDYPSLLSVSDVLDDFGIANVAVRTSAEKVLNFSPPFIAEITPINQIQIRQDEVIDSNHSRSDFVLISEINKENVRYFNPYVRRWINLAYEHFIDKYQGVLLLIEASDQAGEKDHVEKENSQRRTEISYYFSFLAIPVLTLIASYYRVYNWETTSLIAVLNLILTCIGAIVSFLLLLYEYDEFNPVLKEICTANRKTNCNAVLTSKYSKLFGISWSSIGFFYFLSNILILIMLGGNPNAIVVLAWLSLFSFPAIVLSFYYQSAVIKQWCRLCITIQLLLVALFLTNLLSGNIRSLSPDVPFVIAVLACYSITIIVLAATLPITRQLKTAKHYKKRFTELIRNPQVFNSLLKDEKPVTDDPGAIGITVGNRAAKNKIIKVCNPYCAPCAKSHSALEDLLSTNQDLQLQIVFNASNRPGDDRAVAVRHFLAIAETTGEASLRGALNDWYTSDVKDYQRFSENYPVARNLPQENANIELMQDWCNKNQIDSTPTLFINGHRLPSIYNSADLKYLLRSDSSSS